MMMKCRLIDDRHSARDVLAKNQKKLKKMLGKN